MKRSAHEKSHYLGRSLEFHLRDQFESDYRLSPEMNTLPKSNLDFYLFWITCRWQVKIAGEYR